MQRRKFISDSLPFFYLHLPFSYKPVGKAPSPWYQAGMDTFETVDENRKSYDLGGIPRNAAF